MRMDLESIYKDPLPGLLDGSNTEIVLNPVLSKSISLRANVGVSGYEECHQECGKHDEAYDCDPSSD